MLRKPVTEKTVEQDIYIEENNKLKEEIKPIANHITKRPSTEGEWKQSHESNENGIDSSYNNRKGIIFKMIEYSKSI